MSYRPASARSGLLRISLAGLVWGTTGVVVQLLSRTTTLSPVGIGFYRLAVAAVVLLAIGRFPAVITAFRSAPIGLLLTGVSLGAYQALYFVAVTLGGVSVATVVSLGLAPVLIAAWEAVSAGRRPSGSTVTSVTVGVVGLLLIAGTTGRSTGGTPQPLLGLLAATGCGICYAGSTLLSRNQAERIDPMTLTTVSTGIGALALAPLAFTGGPAGLVVPLTAGPLGLLLYLGVIATAGAYALFYNGLRTTTGSTAAVLTLLEPLTAAVLAALVLGESLPGLAVLGGLLMLAAIGVLYRA